MGHQLRLDFEMVLHYIKKYEQDTQRGVQQNHHDTLNPGHAILGTNYGSSNSDKGCTWL